MKVQITVKIMSNPTTDSKLDMVVGAADTVSSVKDRVAALQLIPFPEQDLMLDGEVLEDGRQLADCGVKDSASLDLVVRASRASLVQQLSELLKARDLSCDELGLLYCYKHGVSIGQALKAVSNETTLQEFVKNEKTLQLENNTVVLVRDDTLLKPFSIVAEVEQILQSSGSGAMDIKDLCSKFVHKFNVSLSSIVGMKPADFLARERDLFMVSGRGIVSLRAAQAKTQRVGPGGAGSLPEVVQRAEDMDLPPNVQAPPGLGQAMAAEIADPAEMEALGSAENQQYLDLHNKICGRSHNSKVVQAFTEVLEAVSDVGFLNVERVVRGGSVSKGTAISGVNDAEAVFFLQGLPPAGQDRWLQPLHRAVANVLRERLSAERGLDDVRATEDSVQFRVRGLLHVDLRFSPVLGNYAETVQALGEQGPEARRFYAAALVEQRVQFIARQPGQVKITIRLLKWWRDQQEWSSRLVRPTDEILELMAVYSSVQTKPSDQRQAIANVMSLLSRFDELRIVWSNYYSKGDVWAPLLRQRPLLMDPVNPFVNIADPQAFDARELMAHAQTTHFFW